MRKLVGRRVAQHGNEPILHQLKAIGGQFMFRAVEGLLGPEIDFTRVLLVLETGRLVVLGQIFVLLVRVAVSVFRGCHVRTIIHGVDASVASVLTFIGRNRTDNVDAFLGSLLEGGLALKLNAPVVSPGELC